jgi:membrane fusion protein, adhesin transport system
VTENLDYLEDTREELGSRKQGSAWVMLYLILAIIAAAFVWAYFAEVDMVTVAHGKVVPSSHVQVIQNLEGGLIKKILVHEGDTVKKGQVLIQLDPTRFKAAFESDSTKHAVLSAEIARLTAEFDNRDHLKFPEDLAENHPDIVRNAEKIFQTNRKALQDQLTVLRKSYNYTKQELDVIAPLAREGVMSKLDKIRLQKSLVETQQRILEKEEQYRSTTRNALNKAKAELAVLNQTIAATRDRMQRTVVRSPVNGIIKKIYISTIGEVIDPGMKMMEVVPLDDKLTIKAFVKPDDIGFIKPGDKANVKISAYDYATYGSIPATITTISADAITDNNSKSFYQVLLQTDKNHLGKDSQQLRIMPGMTATVDILTGKKTILNYLLKPFVNAKDTALRER